MNKQNNDIYQEGFNDGIISAQKNYIPINDVSESFDKFFDRINSLKRICSMLYQHLVFDESMEGEKMSDDTVRANNLNNLINQIKIELGKELPKEKKNGST